MVRAERILLTVSAFSAIRKLAKKVVINSASLYV
jgi:hypothetical protein